MYTKQIKNIVPHFLGRKVYAILPVSIIVLPFIYYLWFVHHVLVPVEYPDSFAYLWRDSFNFYYLTGRSLTQRFFYTLAGNNGVAISVIQLLFFFFTALILYFLLAHNKPFKYRGLTACFISFLFSSYTLNISAVIINSEPIFVSLLLLTTAWLFLYNGPNKYTTTFLILMAFLFSKNVAPYYLLLLIGMLFLTSPSYLRDKRIILFFGLIIIVTLSRMHLTNLYDTSIDVNTLNNIYARVFTDSDRTMLFHDKYDMPIGPYVEACRGLEGIAPCLGYGVIIVNSESYNFELFDNGNEFIQWTKNKGQHAYLRYLLVDDPIYTITKYSEAFYTLSTRITIQFVIGYLGAEIPQNEPNNLGQLTNLGKEFGFWGFDPLSILHQFLFKFGFQHAWVVTIYIIFGLIMIHRFKFTDYFPLAISTLSGSLGLFFLTFFGDGMEIRRHVFPSLVLMVFGGLLYVIAWLQVTYFIIKSKLQLETKLI